MSVVVSGVNAVLPGDFLGGVAVAMWGKVNTAQTIKPNDASRLTPPLHARSEQDLPSSAQQPDTSLPFRYTAIIPPKHQHPLLHVTISSTLRALTLTHLLTKQTALVENSHSTLGRENRRFPP